MDENKQELLVITMEECGELIQACSKLIRFGTEKKHMDNLVQELGDVMCLATLLIEHDMCDEADVFQAIENKREKLELWSDLIK